MHFDIRKITHVKYTFDSQFIDQIHKRAGSAPKKQASVGKIVNGEYTTDYNKWCTASYVDFTLFQDQIDIIREKCKQLVEKNYKLKCLNHEINFLHYEDGGEYKSHNDGQSIENNIAKRSVDRDITCVVYLNNDYSGGEIYFDYFDLEIRPKAGEILIYPTTWQYMHKVKPVTGNRYAIVFWFKTYPKLNIEMVIPAGIKLIF